MNIAIFAQNKPDEFSGGRYHSWIMAEALAQFKHNVFYITNNKPIFYDDFSSYPFHQSINLVITPDFWSNLPKSKFDIVFSIPSMDRNPDFFLKVIYFSEINSAKLILLNFETPNWFNNLSPEERSPLLWKNWDLTSSVSTLILSSSIEGNKFAKSYYSKFSNSLIFDYCYPSINSIVADSFSNLKKEKRIILITRFDNATHKGGFNLAELISQPMNGYTLVLIVGSGDIPIEVLNDLKKKAHMFSVKLEIKKKLTDLEKFQEITRSSLMIFPSFFEGFGLPPLEALYCNTPCITFDLPVLREINGDSLIYIETGNWSAFREAVKSTLSSNVTHQSLSASIKKIADFNNYCDRLNSIILKIMNLQSNPKKSIKGFFSQGIFSCILFMAIRCRQFLRYFLAFIYDILFPILLLSRLLLTYISPWASKLNKK